jgi:hypothetical protein
MSDSLILLRDVKSSLGLLNNVNQLVAGTNITLSPTNGIGVVTVNAPATLPSGLVANATFGSPSGGVSIYTISGITGLTANSIITVQAQVMSATDLTAGISLLCAQPVASGGGSIVVYALTPTNPITLSWAVLKF